MTLKLPTTQPDAVLSAIMGVEYAADAAHRDRCIAGRDAFERASNKLQTSRNELHVLENSHAAYQNRAVYFRNISRLHMRITRATCILAELYETFPNDAPNW